MKKLIIAGAALAALTACKGGNSCDSADSYCESFGDSDTYADCGAYNGDIYVGIDGSACAFPVDSGTGQLVGNAVNMGCSGGEWVYDFYTVGVPSSATLMITETSSNAWEEEQPIPQYTYDQDFYWAEFYTVLPIVDSWEDVVEGTNTLYGCDLEGQMTWGLYVYDGGTQVDCVAWGDDPSDFGDCRTSW